MTERDTIAKRVAVAGDDGALTGGTFDLDRDADPDPGVSILWHSRGTTGGTRAYRAGLEAVLARLAGRGLVITAAYLDTRTTRDRSPAERRLAVRGLAYPIDPAELDPADLRARLATAAAQCCRPAGAKGGGNTTRQIRLYVSIRSGHGRLNTSADVLGDLAAALAGEPGPVEVAATATRRRRKGKASA
jgi:hypothetical protein